MPSCTGTKPNYTTFVQDYLSYATTAAQNLSLSIAYVLCQWYEEWGIPANNPGWQIWAPSDVCKLSTTCGAFPMFCTLGDGTKAYIEQMNYYNNNSSHTNVFGWPVSVYNSYNWGFSGGTTANNVTTMDGYSVSVTSQGFTGAIQNGGSGLTGTYAANEAIGASPWNGGHYMLHTDSYPGRQLNVILNDAGWSSYCYVP